MKLIRLIPILIFSLAFQTASLFADTNTVPAGEKPLTSPPHVRIETELGNIEVELDAQHAPITVSNFLRYVDAGHYSNGTFFRTVKPDNQPPTT